MNMSGPGQPHPLGLVHCLAGHRCRQPGWVQRKTRVMPRSPRIFAGLPDGLPLGLHRLCAGRVVRPHHGTPRVSQHVLLQPPLGVALHAAANAKGARCHPSCGITLGVCVVEVRSPSLSCPRGERED